MYTCILRHQYEMSLAFFFNGIRHAIQGTFYINTLLYTVGYGTHPILITLECTVHYRADVFLRPYYLERDRYTFFWINVKELHTHTYTRILYYTSPTQEVFLPLINNKTTVLILFLCLYIFSVGMDNGLTVLWWKVYRAGDLDVYIYCIYLVLAYVHIFRYLR